MAQAVKPAKGATTKSQAKAKKAAGAAQKAEDDREDVLKAVVRRT